MKQVLLSLLFLTATFAVRLSAQPQISIQGIIKGSDGSAVDNGKYDLTFKLYTALTGGTAIWEETQSQLQVTDGIYSAILGAVAALNVSFGQTYFLGISVEGSAELIPRIQLTTVPYAAGVLGGTNVFPAYGNVGIGVGVAGSGIAPLHINSTAEASIFTHGAVVIGDIFDYNLTVDRDEIQARDGNNNEPSILSLNPHGGAVQVAEISNTTDINFKRAGVQRMKIDDNGVDVTGILYISGPPSLNTSGSYNFFDGLTASIQTSSVDRPYNLQVSGTGILAPFFMAQSDRRIKKDLCQSSGQNDLSTLLDLKVTDYRHVDILQNGQDMRKGFIAQEVETVFPEAVSKSPDVVPNIFCIPTCTSLSGSEMTFHLNKNHGLAPGDRVQILLEAGKNIFIVSRVDGEQSFTVSGWNAPADEKVFVYGKEVDDFRTVDYDRIFTLNVSATQELARRLVQLEAENQTLRSDLKTMDSRLSKLENQAAGSAQR